MHKMDERKNRNFFTDFIEFASNLISKRERNSEGYEREREMERAGERNSESSRETERPREREQKSTNHYRTKIVSIMC